jgi:hypothetical protein
MEYGWSGGLKDARGLFVSGHRDGLIVVFLCRQLAIDLDFFACILGLCPGVFIDEGWYPVSGRWMTAMERDVLDTLDTLCDQSLAPGWTEIALFRHCHVALFFVDRNSLCVVVSSVHSTHISSRRLHSIQNNNITTLDHRSVSWTTLGTRTSIHITRHPSPHHRHITSNLLLDLSAPAFTPKPFPTTAHPQPCIRASSTGASSTTSPLPSSPSSFPCSPPARNYTSKKSAYGRFLHLDGARDGDIRGAVLGRADVG